MNKKLSRGRPRGFKPPQKPAHLKRKAYNLSMPVWMFDRIKAEGYTPSKLIVEVLLKEMEWVAPEC